MPPTTMRAVLLTGHGGFDQLQYRTDVPVPAAADGEVLVQVSACGINNTDVNTRIGWYAADVREATSGEREPAAAGGGWTDGLAFPRIQGADVCGVVAAVGADGAGHPLIGRRVLIDPWVLDPLAPLDLAAARYLGSELDGGFAEFCVVPIANVHPVDSALSDAELATFACSSVTAENMLTKTAVGGSDVVVVTGASGGVGTAVVQLAHARGAHVIAVASAAKADAVRRLGADAVVDREHRALGAAVRDASPTGACDVVVDVVGGPMFTALIPTLRPGGRYVSAGAIAGPIVEFDLRQLIYGDLHFDGATVCPPGTFARVVAHIEAGRLRPVLATTYPLEAIVEAQRAFLAKGHVGNIVVTL